MTWSNTPATKQKITVALVAEIQTAIDKATPRRGTGTTGGAAGTTIALSPAETSANYDVSITFTEDPGPNVAGVWVASKATGSFKVYNVGDSGKAFTWTLTRY